MSASRVLPGIVVPTTLVNQPAAFGGTPNGDCLHGDLVLQDGRVVGLKAATAPARAMVLPRLGEPHVHLDKCHTIDRMTGIGGNLIEAITAQRTDKHNWTEADLRTRASRGLAELRAAGCGAIRTHVDWGTPANDRAIPLAWSVLRDLARETDNMDIQLSALIGIAQLADRDFAQQTAQTIARDDFVLGSFVLGQPEREAGIQSAFRMADKFGLALDFHVDEGTESTLDGVELIADTALKHHHQGPILLGHACALTNLPDNDFQRVANKLAKADISVTALPTTNLYLQGRGDGTPTQRGLTRIRELRASGVNVVLGTDNVRDAFCPVGQHAPLQSLALAILAAHLDPPLADHLPMITTQARAAMGLAPVTVDGAAPDDLLIFDITSTSQLIADAPPPRTLSQHRKEPS